MCLLGVPAAAQRVGFRRTGGHRVGETGELYGRSLAIKVDGMCGPARKQRQLHDRLRLEHRTDHLCTGAGGGDIYRDWRRLLDGPPIHR